MSVKTKLHNAISFQMVPIWYQWKNHFCAVEVDYPYYSLHFTGPNDEPLLVM